MKTVGAFSHKTHAVSVTSHCRQSVIYIFLSLHCGVSQPTTVWQKVYILDSINVNVSFKLRSSGL